jgi:hypothetical protein
MKNRTRPSNELILVREYFPRGTNGTITHKGRLLCYTIELPWLNNEPQRSCIPEGIYPLALRFSHQYKDHLLVTGVTGRSYILLHPANNAMAELRGCIAPVTLLTGEGMGSFSRKACRLLYNLVSKHLQDGPFLLTIKSKKHDHPTKIHGANAAFL